jgi:hypothetical protein
MLAKRGVTVDLNALEPWQDPQVWEMISGGARAVHHIESPAMTGLCRQCNVRDIDTLIAIVSVIRPGAANEGKKLAFTRRYQGLEPITYPHPSLEPVLRDTFGLVVYEEHILQICEAFAGLPPGRADVLRRALNKQKRPSLRKFKRSFSSALARGHTPEKIEEVWGLVTGFAGYAFCKAHSTAYGVEAYQSAWLKAKLPGGVHGGGADQRQRLLRSARLCAGKLPAGFEIPAADGQRTRPSVHRAWQCHSRSADACQRAHRTHRQTDLLAERERGRLFRWRTSTGGASRRRKNWRP